MIRPITHSRNRRRGFTLIEASLTCVIVGVGFMAMLRLLAAGTVSNINGIEGTTGTNLCKNVREYFLWNKTWAQLSGMKGTTTSYTPPIDSRGTQLSSFSDWTQIITVQVVDPNRVTLNLANTTANPTALRMTVSVTHHGSQACVLSWYVFSGGP